MLLATQLIYNKLKSPGTETRLFHDSEANIMAIDDKQLWKLISFHITSYHSPSYTSVSYMEHTLRKTHHSCGDI